MWDAPVTDLLACDTRQVLLGWDFSSTYETVKVETTKAPYDRLPWRRRSLTRRMLLVTLCPRSPSLFSWLPDACISLERIVLLVTKPSSQDTEQDKRKILLGLWFFSLWQMMQKKTDHLWEGKGSTENKYSTKISTKITIQKELVHTHIPLSAWC